MAKLKLFANEYSGIITIFGIFLVLLINGIMASYVIGKVAKTVTDVQSNQQVQSQFNNMVTINFNKVSNSLDILSDRLDNLDVDHAKLMKAAGLYPEGKWNRQHLTSPSPAIIKPFPQ